MTIDVVNQYQARFVNEDVQMWDEETDTPALCRTANLCAEIGQVRCASLRRCRTVSLLSSRVNRFCSSADTNSVSLSICVWLIESRSCSSA